MVIAFNCDLAVRSDIKWEPKVRRFLEGLRDPMVCQEDECTWVVAWCRHNIGALRPEGYLRLYSSTRVSHRLPIAEGIVRDGIGCCIGTPARHAGSDEKIISSFPEEHRSLPIGSHQSPHPSAAQF